MIREIARFLPSLCLSVSIAAILITANWPGLGPAWTIETSWVAIIGTPMARIVWAVLALLSAFGAIASRNVVAVIWCFPLAFLAMFAPPRISLETTLLARSYALEVEAQLLTPFLNSEVTHQRLSDAQGIAEAIRNTRSAPDLPKSIAMLFETAGLIAYAAGISEKDAEKLLEGLGLPSAPKSTLAVLENEIALQTKAVLDAELAIDNCWFGFTEGPVVNLDTEHVDQSEIDRCKKRRGDRYNDANDYLTLLTQGRPSAKTADAEAHGNYKAELISKGKSLAAIDGRILAVRAAEEQAKQAASTLFAIVPTVVAALLAALFIAEGSTLFFATMTITIAAYFAAPMFSIPLQNRGPSWEYAVILASVIAFASVFLGLRALRLYIIQNAHLLKLLERKELIGTLGLAGFRWIPLGACVAGGLFASSWLDQRLLDPAYAVFPKEEHSASQATDEDASLQECDPAHRLIATQRINQNCASRQLEIDLEAALVRHFANFDVLVKNSTRDVSRVATSEADWAAIETRRLMAEIPSRLEVLNPTFNYGGCSLLELMGCALNGGKSLARTSYRDARVLAERVLEERLLNLVDSVGASAGLAKASVDTAVFGALLEIRKNVGRFLWAWFRLADVLGFVAGLLLSIAILKSFGYMLIRCLHQLPGLDERIKSAAEKATGSSAIENQADAKQILFGRNNEIEISEAGQYQIASSVGVTGREAAMTLPIASISHILNRIIPSMVDRKRANWAFKEYNLGKDSSPLKLSTGGGRQLTSINLRKNERLGIKREAFVGKERTVRLKSRWGFRMLDLFSGRIRHAVVEGPGLVILRSEGDATLAIIRPDEDDERGADPHTLMAWSSDIDYHVRSGTGWLALYSGSVVVAPAGGGVAIVDGGETTGRLLGALGFVVLLLLPF